jgi:hypothetical protein
MKKTISKSILVFAFSYRKRHLYLISRHQRVWYRFSSLKVIFVFSNLLALQDILSSVLFDLRLSFYAFPPLTFLFLVDFQYVSSFFNPQL